jgi:hypothetical protein
MSEFGNPNLLSEFDQANIKDGGYVEPKIEITLEELLNQEHEEEEEHEKDSHGGHGSHGHGHGHH